MKLPFLLLLCLLTIISKSSLAQNTLNTYWTAVSESSIRNGVTRQIVPQKYLCLQLDESAMREKLLTANHERAVNIHESACVISLPLPNGRMQSFRVVESPVMAPELATAYPQMRTFSIKGIDDVYANGKIDWTEFGFHAMIRTIQGDFFIDPFGVGNTGTYITYYTSDFVKDPAHRMPEESLRVAAEQITDSSHKKQKIELPSRARSAAICAGGQLRTYRLAVACTHQYAKAATGLAFPTKAQTLSRVVTTINRVNGVYETEVAVRLVLVPNDTIVLYTSQASDSFTANANFNASQLLIQSQALITASIGSGNYDIGHTFSTGSGGLATLGCVCKTNSKAEGITGSASPVGDPYDIDYVAHEIGHQFGGNHTFNANTGSCNGNRNSATAVEPGSGVTLMAYAGLCSSNNVAGNSIPYFHAVSYDEIVNYTNSGIGNSCPVTSTTGNQAPVVSGSGNYTIPKSTPFILTGSGVDPDGDPITFSWEEIDPGYAGGNWNSGMRPYFRSYVPVVSPTRLFPKLSVVINGNYTGSIGEYLPGTAQLLNFRLTARDNKMGGGGVCYAQEQITVDSAGPFVVLYPSDPGIGWYVGSTKTIVWDPAQTDQPPVSCDSVRIWISYDSGNNYSLLINSAPNYGWQQITAPNLSTTINTCRIKVESIGNIFYDISNNDFTISTDPDVGIQSYSNSNPLALSIWPNPAGNHITVWAGNLFAQEPTGLVVLDLLGKTVMERTYFDRSEIRESLDISQLSEGLYFVKVNNGHQQSVYRIVKR